MTETPYIQKGTPTVKGYYGVNTVDFIPSLLEWTGDKWIYPDGRFIEYPKADVISWVLVASNEDAVTIHKPQERKEMKQFEIINGQPKRKAVKLKRRRGKRESYEPIFKKLREKQKPKLTHQYLMENW